MPDHSFDIGFREYKILSYELNLTDQMVDDIAGNFATDPIKTPRDWGRFLGDITVIDNPREKVRQLLRAVQQSPAPKVTIRFMCDGSCDDLAAVTIDAITTTPDRNVVNFNAFGMGVSITFVPTLSQGLSRIAANGCPEGQKRKIQEFLLDWHANYNIVPGVGGNVHVKTETIEGKSPCCPVAAGGAGGGSGTSGSGTGSSGSGSGSTPGTGGGAGSGSQGGGGSGGSGSGGSSGGGGSGGGGGGSDQEEGGNYYVYLEVLDPFGPRTRQSFLTKEGFEGLLPVDFPRMAFSEDRQQALTFSSVREARAASDLLRERLGPRSEVLIVKVI